MSVTEPGSLELPDGEYRPRSFRRPCQNNQFVIRGTAYRSGTLGAL
jgi:hypothetical protein